MSAIFLPRRWRHQPPRGVELDLRNPLTDGLIVFCLGQNQFFPGALSYSDSGGVNPIYSPEGESLGFAAGGYRVANNWIYPAGRYTGALVVGATPAADITDGNRTYIAGARNGATSGSTRLYLRRIGGNIAGFGVNDTAVVTPTENVVWPTGERGIIALSWTVANVFGFFNGRQLYAHGSALSADVNYLTINSLPIGSAGTYAGANIHHFAGVWSRPLSDAEQWEIGQAPYQIFRAPSHRIWFDVGASSGGTTYNESFTESASVDDGFGGSATFASALTETTTADDALDPLATFFASYAESIAAGDSPAGAQTMPVAFSEDVTAGDSLTDEVVPAGSFNDTIAESATAEDAYTTTQAHVEAFAEQIIVGDGYAVTGGTEIEQTNNLHPIIRVPRYSVRLGGQMVYADSPMALKAAIEDFERQTQERARKKAAAVAQEEPQTTPKRVARTAPRAASVEAPDADLLALQAFIAQTNERIRQAYEQEARTALLARHVAIEIELRQRDDEEALIALEIG